MSKSLKKKYNNLETEVKTALREKIRNSKVNSGHISNCKCIKVNIFGYIELIEYYGNLTFLDIDGYHYSLYADCSLEDLIDIL